MNQEPDNYRKHMDELNYRHERLKAVKLLVREVIVACVVGLVAYLLLR